MSRLCLDTSAYSLLRRGNEQASQFIDSAEWVGLPAIVIGELWAGFQAGAHRERNARELVEFLSDPIVEELIVDREVAQIYGEIFDSLKKSGTPIPINDVWIAACAARHGATVLTFDAHFENIKRVGTILISAE